MPSRDRRDIEPLLKDHFPNMVGKSSAEWGAFLNALTDCNVEDDVWNGAAFDTWRKALAARGYAGVWPYTDAQISEMQDRARKMAQAEKDRLAALKENANAKPV